MKVSIVLLIVCLLLSSCKGNIGEKLDDDTKNNSSFVESENSKQERPKSEEVVVPDVTGCDEETAKTILLNQGLIPVISEEPKYSDVVQYGMVCETNPAINSNVAKNTKVNIYKSRGVQTYSLTSYHCTWVDYSWWKEQYKINSASVFDGILTISLSHNCSEEYTFDNITDAVVDGVKTKANVSSNRYSVSNQEYVNDLTVTIDLNSINSYKPSKIDLDLGYNWMSRYSTSNFSANLVW